MTTLTKDDIFKADDLPTEDMDIPEWGGTLTVRTLTGTERDEWESAVSNATRGKRTNTRGIKVRLIQLAVLNGDGKLMFTEADLPELNKKSASVIDRVFQVAQHLSGLLPEDVEEMAGNSGTATVAASGSS